MRNATLNVTRLVSPEACILFTVCGREPAGLHVDVHRRSLTHAMLGRRTAPHPRPRRAPLLYTDSSAGSDPPPPSTACSASAAYRQERPASTPCALQPCPRARPERASPSRRKSQRLPARDPLFGLKIRRTAHSQVHSQRCTAIRRSEAHQGRIMGQSVTSPPRPRPALRPSPPPSFSQPISLSCVRLVVCAVRSEGE